jgi:hypothetical protein
MGSGRLEASMSGFGIEPILSAPCTGQNSVTESGKQNVDAYNLQFECDISHRIASEQGVQLS